MIQRIDAHHHLWRYQVEEFDWIDDSMKSLRRDFLAEQLATEAQAANVVGTVAVQARQSIDETEFLLQAADASVVIRGVVGWLPLASPTFEQELSRFSSAKYLKGLRHVVQAEPPGFLDGAEFNRGISALRGTGLVYDLLLHRMQLEEATRFVDRHPDQSFVLDHLAKPAVSSGDPNAWAAQLTELAKRPNVACKLSGLVTEAQGYEWSPELLAPFFDTALNAFGAERLLAATDWPVLTVGCSYAQWWQTLEAWCAPLTESERQAILGGSAIRIYGLDSDGNV